MAMTMHDDELSGLKTLIKVEKTKTQSVTVGDRYLGIKKMCTYDYAKAQNAGFPPSGVLFNPIIKAAVGRISAYS